MASANHHPVVCCRIRPIISANEKGIVTTSQGKDGTRAITVDKQMTFELDHVFDVNSSQEQVFNNLMPNLLQDLMKGINCTLFTYGQTGSGKTFTMQGPGDNGTSRGLIPRVVESIFQLASERALKGNSKCEIFMSMLEIYQEKLFDLLSASSSNNNSSTFGGDSDAAGNSSSLRIRELADGTIFVQGLSEIAIKDAIEFQTLCSQGLKKRVTGSHAMNAESSRSHLCCIIFVKQQTTNAHNNSTSRVSSKIHLIDLAGSELVRKTGADGTRLQEAKYINKSLSALGNVINALTNKLVNGINNATGMDASGKGIAAIATAGSTSVTAAAPSPAQHIPYRDSKLTRVLQDSLRGNSRIVLIVTISSSVEHINETIATLRFGDRAKKLTIKPRVNVELDDKDYKSALLAAQRKINSLTDTIVELQEQLSNLQAVARSNNISNDSSSSSSKDPQICSMCSGALTVVSKPEATKQNKKSKSLDTTAQDDSHKLPPIHPQAVQATKEQPKSKANAKPESRNSAETVTPKANNKQRQNQTPSPPTVPVNLPKELVAQQSVEPIGLDLVDIDNNRCAVCNLDEIETEALRRDTGEVLGSMFMCDGNCGQRFHVRCVGLVGDAGQFMLPEGEWLCSLCSMEVDVDQENAVNVGVGGEESESDKDSSKQSSRAPSAGAGEHGKDAMSQLNELKFDGDCSLFNNSDLLMSMPLNGKLGSSSIEADYHIMRRERNRILQQWQHEKKIAKLIAEKRQQQDIERDKEVVGLYNEVGALKDELTTKDAALRAVQKEKDELLAQLATVRQATQFSNDVATIEHNEFRAYAKFNKMSECLLHLSNDVQTDNGNGSSSASLSPDPSNSTQNKDIVELSISGAGAGGPKLTLMSRSLDSKLGAALSFDPLRAATLSAKSGSSATEAESSNIASAIPKPWMKKKSMSSKSADASSKAASISSTLLSTPMKESSVIVPLSNIDAKLSSYSFGGLHSNKSDAKVLPLLYENEDVATDSSYTDAEITYGQDDTLPAKTADFLAPMQSRLKGLLQAVKAETDSYAEIRLKHLEREGERSQLRSRNGGNSSNATDRLLASKIRLNEKLSSSFLADDSL